MNYTAKDLSSDTRLMDEIRNENDHAELMMNSPLKQQRDALYSALNNLLTESNDITRNTALLVLYKVKLDMEKE